MSRAARIRIRDEIACWGCWQTARFVDGRNPPVAAPDGVFRAVVSGGGGGSLPALCV